jgi:hypothetical protein
VALSRYKLTKAKENCTCTSSLVPTTNYKFSCGTIENHAREQIPCGHAGCLIERVAQSDALAERANRSSRVQRLNFYACIFVDFPADVGIFGKFSI